jgi:hypothetical protein
MFDHEKLDVYQLELKFLGWATEFLVEISRKCNAISCVPAPKGHKDLAQGFNPGYDVLKRCALKGHQSWLVTLNSHIQNPARIPSGAPVRAHPPTPRYPGLKPWATSLRPFGAKDDEDSLSDEACFPLQRPRLAIRRSRKDERRGAGNP